VAVHRHPQPRRLGDRLQRQGRLEAQSRRAARVVNLTYFDPDGVNTAPLAVERTNKKGMYTIDVPTPAFQGRYQLSVEAQKIRAKGKKQKCNGAESAVLTH
jgi:hypothetical protein